MTGSFLIDGVIVIFQSFTNSLYYMAISKAGGEEVILIFGDIMNLLTDNLMEIFVMCDWVKSIVDFCDRSSNSDGSTHANYYWNYGNSFIV